MINSDDHEMVSSLAEQLAIPRGVLTGSLFKKRCNKARRQNTSQWSPCRPARTVHAHIGENKCPHAYKGGRPRRRERAAEPNACMLTKGGRPKRPQRAAAPNAHIGQPIQMPPVSSRPECPGRAREAAVQHTATRQYVRPSVRPSIRQSIQFDTNVSWTCTRLLKKGHCQKAYQSRMWFKGKGSASEQAPVWWPTRR
eukprot:360747-Chlamydomonas_euryale.AAC.3